MSTTESLNLSLRHEVARLGSVSKVEMMEIRAERQMDGIQKAKERGVHFGPKKKLTPEQITELQVRRAQGTLIKTLMHDYGLSKVSVYRYLGHTDASLSVQNASSALLRGRRVRSS